MKAWVEGVMQRVETWHCEESPEETIGEGVAQLQQEPPVFGSPQCLEVPTVWETPAFRRPQHHGTEIVLEKKGERRNLSCTKNVQNGKL